MYKNQNNGYRILIADDEPLNIECLYSLLHKLGYKISIANNGEMCVKLVETIDPSLVIIDWDMPVMDGIEAIFRIRKSEKNNHIPIIMATGKMLTSNHLKKALEAGANDFIRKPIDSIEVTARVKSMLRLQAEHIQNIQLEKKLHEQKMLHLKQELEKNEKELALSTLKLLQLNGNFEHLESRLSEIINSDNHIHFSRQLKQLLRDFTSTIAASNWKEFETAFTKVHTNFYHKLDRNFPNLTLNERNICAFIRLNMTTKKIASITHQSEIALNKARYRLRKKLGISNKTNLNTFLQSF